MDADRRPGQFLLTGSSNVFDTLEATDSLAGRMPTLTLWPLSLAEIEDLSGIVGIKRQTLDGCLDVLTRLSVVARLPTWSASDSRRDIRSAKVPFTDSGVAAAPRGLTPASFEPDADPTAFGALLETGAFGEIARSLPFQRGHFRLYHWRDRDAHEVDLLAESAEGLVAIEVKAASSPAQ